MLLLCVKCSQEKQPNEFTAFKRNPALKTRKGYVVWCKSCVAEYLNLKGNTKQSLREICQLIDIPYIEKFADSALKSYKERVKKNEKGIGSNYQTNIFSNYARYIGVMNQNYLNYSYSDKVRDEGIEGKIDKLEQLKQDLIPKEVIERESKIKTNRNYLIKMFGEETYADVDKLSKVIQIKFKEFDAYGDTTARQRKYQLKLHVKYLTDEGVLDKGKFAFLYENDEEFVNIRSTVKEYSDEWRGEYTEEDLEYLNDYYNDLKADFKLITRNHRDYARKIAKASLAMDKAYEKMVSGEVGSEKRYKELRETFDTLSKSAQFAENTRGQNDVALGCFGKVFERVENHNWIPEWDSLEKDEIDKLLEQFSNINKSL